MARVKIYCEVTCNNCGVLASESAYYKNASTISKLKEATKDWVWDESLGGNLCPGCQEELKKKPKLKNVEIVRRNVHRKRTFECM